MLEFFLQPLMTIPLLGFITISSFLIASISPDIFVNHIANYAVGILLFAVTAHTDMVVWKRFKTVIYVVAVISLVLCLFSTDVRGAQRWIQIGEITLFQPSEIFKPFFIMIFAFYLAENETINRFSSLFKSFILFAPVAFLIFRQPDLGNVIVYTSIFIAMLIISGLKVKYILIGTVLCTVLIPVLWFFMQSYQKDRILSFINPSHDPSGVGYNAMQSVISIGSGKVFGSGLGRGSQSKLRFLPEYHTDFVFASLVEELGIIGAGLTVSFYCLLFLAIARMAYISRNSTYKIFAIGILVQNFTQVFINIGMNIGLLPITGITLPLLSYGGSSIISTFIGLGLLASLKEDKWRNPLVIR